MPPPCPGAGPWSDSPYESAEGQVAGSYRLRHRSGRRLAVRMHNPSVAFSTAHVDISDSLAGQLPEPGCGSIACDGCHAPRLPLGGQRRFRVPLPLPSGHLDHEHGDDGCLRQGLHGGGLRRTRANLVLGNRRGATSQRRLCRSRPDHIAQACRVRNGFSQCRFTGGSLHRSMPGLRLTRPDPNLADANASLPVLSGRMNLRVVRHAWVLVCPPTWGNRCLGTFASAGMPQGPLH